jgi:dihydropteroate synthase
MTQLVGILNITPDSFSDGGQFMTPEAAIAQARKLFIDGAELVDVGAESTRPQASALTAAQERARLEPVLPALLAEFPGRLSLDTYHPETADWALSLGDVVINDVTGMSNPRMIEVVTRRGARCIVSHLPGNDIQAAHSGELLDNISVVVDDLLAIESLLRAEGLDAEDIILDPGIGFGKTPELNRQLLEFAKYVPAKQVMIGYSRKRFLGEQRMELAPNLAAGRIAAAAGAAYLRVHDVAGHQQLLYTNS